MTSGPKYKYADWMCDCVREVASVPGQYQAAMLLEIGRRLYNKEKPISPDTFARWRKENINLEEAWQESQIISQALDEKALMDFASGKTKGNATGFAILFNTKYKHEYKPESSGNTTNITNNTLNIENLSLEELKYRIARSEETLQKAGQLPYKENNKAVIDGNYEISDA